MRTENWEDAIATSISPRHQRWLRDWWNFFLTSPTIFWRCGCERGERSERLRRVEPSRTDAKSCMSKVKKAMVQRVQRTNAKTKIATSCNNAMVWYNSSWLVDSVKAITRCWDASCWECYSTKLYAFEFHHKEEKSANSRVKELKTCYFGNAHQNCFMIIYLWSIHTLYLSNFIITESKHLSSLNGTIYYGFWYITLNTFTASARVISIQSTLHITRHSSSTRKPLNLTSSWTLLE